MSSCGARQRPANNALRFAFMRKLIPRNGQSPGDIVTLTAAVRDLQPTHLANSDRRENTVARSMGKITTFDPAGQR
jgi:hypothetical protein